MRKLVHNPYLQATFALILSVAFSLLVRLDFENAELILRELRIPRMILGVAVGAGLALSGLVMQTVLSNPLAEPYTLGVASGAALGAAIGVSLGIHTTFFGFNIGAIVGAVLVISILFGFIAKRIRRNDSLILTGVMISLTAASMLAIWMAISDPMGVQSINFWLLGDLSRVGLSSALGVLAVTLLISAIFILFSRRLDAFLFGEDAVEGFGVSRKSTQVQSVFLISLLVGCSVSAAGVIGFLGLIVPHMVRKRSPSHRHREMIPLTLLGGATLLTFSDGISRVVGGTYELPVGAITAVVGAPVFVALFIAKNSGEVE